MTSGGNWNAWYGWTVAENGAKGWASALDARGGSDDGAFGGVPVCNGTQGPPQAPVPELCGTWATTPPAPCAPGSTTPPASRPPAVKHPYQAGQPLSFDGGYCTSAFPVRVGSRVLGLTAGHCRDGGFSYVDRFGAHPAWLGDVVHDADSSGVDALVFGASSGLPVAWRQEIYRAAAPALSVTGLVRTEEQVIGSRVCMAGLRSGYDKCGTITTGFTAHGPVVDRAWGICTDIPVRRGDSGGPVYRYHSWSKGTRGALALGVVSFDMDGEMCYLPIDAALRAVGADARLPQPRRTR